MGQYAGLKALGPVSDRVEPILNNYAPSSDELSSLQGLIRELLSMARMLLNIQREAQSLVPPPELSRLHELYLQISPAYLRRFWKFAGGVQELVEGRFTGTKLDLSINLDIPEHDALISEFNRVNSTKHEPQSACFIATAAYGSDMEPHVAALRRFRDLCLRRYLWGRALIAIYERESPAIARRIQLSPQSRWITRKLLLPVVLLAAAYNAFGQLRARQSLRQRTKRKPRTNVEKRNPWRP
jgi:hypothetical protein